MNTEENGLLLTTVFITAIGVYLYWYMKRKESIKLITVLISFFALFFYTFSHDNPPYQAGVEMIRAFDYHAPCEISTAWVYEKPVDKNVVNNVKMLAKTNRKSRVCIYCGTTQCMKTFRGLKSNIVTRFAIISDLVQGTLLQEWLSRHPFNKVIAGRAFETHLQEVTALGILWKFGGIYVNPTVRVGYGARFPSNTNYSWVSKEERRRDNDLPSVFDAAYFPRNNPFVEKLSQTFFLKYPKDDAVPFQFNFNSAVWKLAKAKCKSSLSCPVVLKKANLVHTPLTFLKMPQHFSLLPSGTSHNITLQNLADLHYLPFVDSSLNSPSKTSGSTTIIGLPTRNLPLSKLMNPIALSVHVEQSEMRVWGQKIKDLPKNPIGCRDSRTLNFFEAHGTRAFLSGSMILLMSRTNNQTRSGIVATVSESIFKLLPKGVQTTAVLSTDYKNNLPILESYKLVQRYQSANLVISEDIDHALLCAALETPVIFVNSIDKLSTADFTPLFHTLDVNGTRQKAASWFGMFPWHEIPQNPNLAKLMRFKTTLWDTLRQEQAFHDAARRFGIIPMVPLISKYKEDLLFHIVFTTSKNQEVSINKSHKEQSGEFNWRHMRAVESIFHHHPTAKVIVHSNTLSQDGVQCPHRSGLLYYCRTL